MKIGYFILNEGLREDPSVTGLLSDLEAASCEVYEIRSKSDVLPETDLVLSMGIKLYFNIILYYNILYIKFKKILKSINI